MISGVGFKQYIDAFNRGEISTGDEVGVKVHGFFSDNGTILYKILGDGTLQCANFPPVNPSGVLHDYAKWERYPK